MMGWRVMDLWFLGDPRAAKVQNWSCAALSYGRWKSHHGSSP